MARLPFLSPIFAALLVLLPSLLAGCTAGPPPGPRPERSLVPHRARSSASPGETAAEGTTRALVVLVRFADDTTAGDACLNYRGWPYDPGSTAVPSFARGLLAPSPRPPFPDTSLTDYFYQQSNGRFVLYGDVFPRVYVTRKPAAAYARGADSGYGHLTAELLEDLDTEIDFTRYDTNPRDGRLDQIFILVRADPRATFTGVANLYGADAVRGLPRRELSFDGIRVDWNHSGSYFIHRRPGNIIPQHYYVRLMAHEFGHHLWNTRGFFRSGHARTIGTQARRSDRREHVGYILMAGRGGARDARGDELISPFERDLLGWLDPIPLPAGPDFDTTFVLRDAYLSGDALRIPLADGDPATEDPLVYVENRQPLGPFDRPRVWRKPGCRTFAFRQLRDDGLLVQLSDPATGEISVLPADGTLSLSTDDENYAGDLFGPPDAVQLSPWTTPGLRRPDGRPVWLALDDIRPTGRGEGAMSVRLVSDIRRDPIIRSASVMDSSIDGYTFARPIRVETGVELSILSAVVRAPGVELGSEARLVIGPDAGIRLGAGGLVREPGATVVVEGLLELPAPAAEQEDIELRRGATLIVGVDTVRAASAMRWRP